MAQNWRCILLMHDFNAQFLIDSSIIADMIRIVQSVETLLKNGYLNHCDIMVRY